MQTVNVREADSEPQHGRWVFLFLFCFGFFFLKKDQYLKMIYEAALFLHFYTILLVKQQE